MNHHQTEGQWNEFTAKVKQEWGKITDDDVKQAEGNVEELKAKIQQRYGDSKESIAKKFNDFFNS
ncbi:MAG: CsbD family protein [Wenzhouxiangellaceae bacterium]